MAGGSFRCSGLSRLWESSCGFRCPPQQNTGCQLLDDAQSPLNCHLSGRPGVNAQRAKGSSGTNSCNCSPPCLPDLPLVHLHQPQRHLALRLRRQLPPHLHRVARVRGLVGARLSSSGEQHDVLHVATSKGAALAAVQRVLHGALLTC